MPLKSISPPLSRGTAKSVLAELESLGDSKIAEHSKRFFKTGKGEYGAGDMFLGVRVPALRACAKRHFRSLSNVEVKKILRSKFHEARLLAVIIWTHQFDRGDESTQRVICDSYLESTRYINNWDIVDASCHKIVGPLLSEKRVLKDVRGLLRSKDLWERRIAMVATYREIKAGRLGLVVEFAETLLRDKEDLIHKAAGWMLREAGKVDGKLLRRFLDEHRGDMPRTMLRYAIERLPEKERKRYLAK